MRRMREGEKEGLNNISKIRSKIRTKGRVGMTTVYA